MRFERFEIRNFKGIESVDIDLTPAGSGIFTLIGLNESGKTTILEAISKFSPDLDQTTALYKTSPATDNPATYVPKQHKSNFTGEIIIRAVLAFDEGEINQIVNSIAKKGKYRLKPESIPPRIEMTRGFSFKNSDLVGPLNEWDYGSLMYVEHGKRAFKEMPHNHAVAKDFFALVIGFIPKVVYFPTFLFDQPDKIILNPGDGENAVNRLYREIIGNVAKSLPNPLDVKTHIVERVLSPSSSAGTLFSLLSLVPDKQQQIEAVMGEMSAHLTETIFARWSKIFSGSFNGREILLRLGVEKAADGTNSVYIQFVLKDGSQQYEISERSLGFRWFFSFLLFTVYTIYDGSESNILFLLDEPAANLHSRAQMQLLESFPKIATGSNRVIYSTHSHYMIEPRWLDQAFIVSNSAIDYDDVSEAHQTRRRFTNISATKYRTFVGINPDKTTYFQPVLDKLDVVPSHIDLVKPSVVVEGKGDYLILEYGRRIILRLSSRYSIVPTRGASGCQEIVGLLLGWGVPTVLCLDADRAGMDAKHEFLNEWCLSPDCVYTLEDIDPALAGKRIEHMLSDDDRLLIGKHYGIATTPNKGQIQLFFSEKLALGEVVELSGTFRERIASFDNLVTAAFSKITEPEITI